MRHDDSQQIVASDEMHAPAKCDAEKDERGEIFDLSNCPKMAWSFPKRTLLAVATP